MDNQQRIRERAHIIWENEGRQGEEKDYLARAARELGLSQDDSASVVAGELPEGVSQGGHPVTVISGNFAQEEPPYASVGSGIGRSR